MDFGLYLPAVLAAFLITLLEMTEVVVLVIAVSADHPTARPGATGAVVGVTVVSAAAVGVGAALSIISHSYLLWVSALLLTGFGVFLLRSTLRSYRRAALPPDRLPRPRWPGPSSSARVSPRGRWKRSRWSWSSSGSPRPADALSAVVGALVGGGP